MWLNLTVYNDVSAVHYQPKVILVDNIEYFVESFEMRQEFEKVNHNHDDKSHFE